MFKRPITFLKAQLSSVLASATDFLMTYLLSSSLGYWYVMASLIGTLTGGMVNFIINRIWVFNSRQQSTTRQAFRYLVVWSGSMALNLGGVVFFTEVFKWHYLVSKAIISIIVGYFFNFLLQQHFVFVKNE